MTYEWKDAAYLAGRVKRLDERLVLWQRDITTLKIDAIVNAANGALRGCFGEDCVQRF